MLNLLSVTPCHAVDLNAVTEASPYSARIREQLIREGVSSSKLADALGLKQNSAKRILVGDRGIPAKHFKRLARLLNTTVATLLSGGGSEPRVVLTEEERQLLDYFRRLNDGQRRIVMGLAAEFADKRTGTITSSPTARTKPRQPRKLLDRVASDSALREG